MRIFWHVLLVFCALVALAGAVAPAPIPAQAPPERLVSDDEIGRIERDLVAALAANAAGVFRRPVVGRSVLPGPAAPDQLVLLEPLGRLAECEAAFGGLSVEERLLARMTPALTALDARCGEVVAKAFSRAASHLDAGSALRVGRSQTVDLRAIGRLAHLAGLRAMRLASAGGSRNALHLLLDVLTVAEDLTRGGVTLLSHHVITKTARATLRLIWDTLESSVLTLAELDELAEHTDTLLASFPPFESVLRGESAIMALSQGLLPLRHRTWVPPGGRLDYGPEESRNADGMPEPWPPTHDARDAFALTLVAHLRNGETLGRACPASRGALDCVRALQTLAADQVAQRTRLAETARSEADALLALATDPKADFDGLLDAAVQSIHRGTDPMHVRARISEALGYGLLSDPAERAAEATQWLIELAAMRLHLEVLRFRAREGRWPGRPDWDVAPLAPLRLPIGLGAALQVDFTPTSVLVGAPSGETLLRSDLPWVIHGRP